MNRKPTGPALGLAGILALAAASGCGGDGGPEAPAADAATAEAPSYPAMTTEAEYLRAMRELSNWGRWGEADELGAANLITPQKRVGAAALVRDGVSVSLAHDVVQESAIDAGTVRSCSVRCCASAPPERRTSTGTTGRTTG